MPNLLRNARLKCEESAKPAPSRCSEISGRRPMKKPRFCQTYSLFKVIAFLGIVLGMLEKCSLPLGC